MKRPFEVTPDLLIAIERSMANGEGLVEVAAKLGLSLRYFKQLVRENQDLHDAVDVGLTAYEAYFLRKGKELAFGELQGKDAAWYKFMEAEFGWSTKNTLKLEDEIKNKTDEELDAEIKRLQNKND